MVNDVHPHDVVILLVEELSFKEKVGSQAESEAASSETASQVHTIPVVISNPFPPSLGTNPALP